MKIEISKGKIKGSIEYFENRKQFTVVFSNAITKSKIEHYLKTKRLFNIPISQEIDDYRVDKEFPVKSEMYFSLTLCALFTKTGVWVHWETEE